MCSKTMTSAKVFTKLATLQRLPVSLVRQMAGASGEEAKPYIFIKTQKHFADHIPRQRSAYALDLEELQNKAAEMNLAARVLRERAAREGPMESWKSVLLRKLINDEDAYDAAFEKATSTSMGANMGNSLLELNYNNYVAVLCIFNDEHIVDLQRSLHSVMLKFKARPTSALHRFAGHTTIKAFMTKHNSIKRERDLLEEVKSDGKTAGATSTHVDDGGKGLLRFECDASNMGKVMGNLKGMGYTILSTDMTFERKKVAEMTGGLIPYYNFLQHLLAVPGIVAVYDNVERDAEVQGNLE